MSNVRYANSEDVEGNINRILSGMGIEGSVTKEKWGYNITTSKGIAPRKVFDLAQRLYLVQDGAFLEGSQFVIQVIFA